MATQKPDYMTQQAWDYLLQFTVAHEAMVLHMYNYPNANLENTSAGDGYADVCKMRMHPEAVIDKMAIPLLCR